MLLQRYEWYHTTLELTLYMASMGECPSGAQQASSLDAGSMGLRASQTLLDYQLFFVHYDHFQSRRTRRLRFGRLRFDLNTPTVDFMSLKPLGNVATVDLTVSPIPSLDQCACPIRVGEWSFRNRPGRLH